MTTENINLNKSMEIPFFGHEFAVGEKVQFESPEYFGYIKRFPDIDVVNDIFQIAAVEQVHYPGTGDHNDVPDHIYQTVELKELPGHIFANDRFRPAENFSNSELAPTEEIKIQPFRMY